jgi:hypothetical protein
VLDLAPCDGVELDASEIDHICAAFAEVVDAKSPFTFRHSLGVAEAADRIAGQMGLDAERRVLVHRASLLHDLGKLSVPNSILDKPGKLSAQEWGVVEGHPGLSRQILSRVRAFGEVAAVAGEHHEKLDGSGYPEGLRGEQMSIESRVLAVASPALLDQRGRPAQPADLARLPALSSQEHEGAQLWELLDGGGERVTVEVQARLVCGDFAVLLEAARRGMGVTLLPDFVCAPAITRGELEVVLPEWSVPQGTMHFVYPSRRGMLPGVRALVDFLAERLPEAARVKHEQCKARELKNLP